MYTECVSSLVLTDDCKFISRFMAIASFNVNPTLFILGFGLFLQVEITPTHELDSSSFFFFIVMNLHLNKA